MSIAIFARSRIHLDLSSSNVADSITSENMLDSDLCENGSVVKCLPLDFRPSAYFTEHRGVS